MGTPFNDQWQLLRSSRRRRSDRAPSHGHLEPVSPTAAGTEDERLTPPASIHRRPRRTRWIDRDT